MNDFERPTPNQARTTRAYPRTPDEVLAAAGRAVEKLPRWTLESSADGELHAVRETRVFRFKDDVRVSVEEQDTGSEARFESASRVGRSDLGQNPRNLKELISAIDRELGA